MNKKYLTRREALRWSGFAGASIFLSAATTSRAQEAGDIPPRVVFLLSQNGVMDTGWAVSGGSNALTIGGSMSPLDRHAADMVVVEGLRYAHDGGGHVFGSLSYLTNQPANISNGNDPDIRAMGPSLDYVLAQDLRGRGYSGANLLLTACAGSSQWGGGEFITYEGPLTPVSSVCGADNIFQRVFGNYTPPAQDPQADALREWRKRGRRSVLDFALEEYRGLKKQLGPVQQARLEALAERIRTIEEQRIDADGGSSHATVCQPGTAPGVTEWDADVLPASRAILAESLHCGETLVATLRMSNGPIPNTQHHAWHHGEDSPNWAQLHDDVTTWQADQVALFIDDLKSRSLGQDNLLDHTLIVWSNEIGLGGVQEHSGNNLPVLLAGSCGGRVRTQQLISLPNGRTHSQLLTSVANAMGMSATGFGDMTGCDSGDVSGLLV